MMSAGMVLFGSLLTGRWMNSRLDSVGAVLPGGRDGAIAECRARTVSAKSHRYIIYDGQAVESSACVNK